jgi:hypothetical protein
MRYEGIQSNFAFRSASPDSLLKDAKQLIDVRPLDLGPLSLKVP